MLTIDNVISAMRQTGDKHDRRPRTQEALALAMSPPYLEPSEGYTPYCMYCGEYLDNEQDFRYPHAPDCLWPHLRALAVAYRKLRGQWEEVMHALDHLGYDEIDEWNYKAGDYPDILTHAEWMQWVEGVKQLEQEHNDTLEVELANNEQGEVPGSVSSEALVGLRDGHQAGDAGACAANRDSGT